MAGSSKFYTIEGNRIVRSHKACPKCGPGVFLANHEDRKHCGKCGHTERPAP